MISVIGLLSIFILYYVRITSAELPNGVIACPVTNDLPSYNKCVREQLKVLTPFLGKGIPSLKLPALEPLFLPALTIDRNLESLKIRANMSNIRVFGGTNYLIDDIRANPINLTVVLKAHIPFLHVRGDYDVQGRLLLLPLSGTGFFKGNFTNTQVIASARGKEVNKNGIKKIELDKLVTKIRVGDGNIKLKAPQNHALAADTAANFFNSNPRLVLDIATPIIEDTAATISKALAARALSTFTKDEIVPVAKN